MRNKSQVDRELVTFLVIRRLPFSPFVYLRISQA
nr:MAG TPA: GRIP-related Arf-binding domain [Caudoviricetes sp.]